MYYNRSELKHHGVKGQKWGVRRYQNPDGTLTNAGRKRIASRTQKLSKYHDKFKKSEQKREKYITEYNNMDGLKKTMFGSNKLSYANDADSLSKIYRDKSKKMIEQVSKLDPKLGAQLNKKYSKMLNKTTLQDFTLKELTQIQKNPDKLDDKAKNFLQQETMQMLAKQKIKDVAMNNFMQLQIQQQMDMQIHQQMQQQIQQQMEIQMQTQQLIIDQNHYMGF